MDNGRKHRGFFKQHIESTLPLLCVIGCTASVVWPGPIRLWSWSWGGTRIIFIIDYSCSHCHCLAGCSVFISDPQSLEIDCSGSLLPQIYCEIYFKNFYVPGKGCSPYLNWGLWNCGFFPRLYVGKQEDLVQFPNWKGCIRKMDAFKFSMSHHFAYPSLLALAAPWCFCVMIV